MSYDLLVWSRLGEADLTPDLANLACVQTAADQWEFTSNNWMISIVINPVDDDDIPDQVFTTLRGITHQISIHLMPLHASETAMKTARRIARSLAEAGEGVWEDLQTGKLTLSKSAKLSDKRIEQPSENFPDRGKSVTILSVDWCMNHSSLMTRDGVSGFLSLLQRFLPEALPRRYGPYEPLKFKYAEMGKEHFIATYLDDPATSIYCTKPAFSLSLPFTGHGYRKIGMQNRYWASHVGISLNAKILDDPYWAAHLPKAFVEISRYLQPFYGDARCLVGYEVSRNGALMLLTRDAPTSNGMAQSSPVSPWWRGVPRSTGIACVIGSPYKELWSDRKNWETRDGLAFLQPTIWTPQHSNYSVPDNIAEPPERITELRTAEDLRRHQEIEAIPAPIFPF